MRIILKDYREKEKRRELQREEISGERSSK